MGATYLSMQLRTIDRDAAVAALEAIAAANVAAGLRFYVTDPLGGWLAVFPNFHAGAGAHRETAVGEAWVPPRTSPVCRRG